MAGGVGSRFWPASTEERPKQFIDFLGTGRSLLQQSYDRLAGIATADQYLILTNEKYISQIQDQLPAIQANQILLEPARRNTGPCIYYAALKSRHLNPDAVMLIIPSDQIILKEETYRDLIKKAADFAANNDSIVTLGILPNHPNTGYGYIELSELLGDKVGVQKVMAFKEKPDLNTAKKYIQSNKYLWNAGMFIARASTILMAFERYQQRLVKEFRGLEKSIGLDDEEAQLKACYPLAESISFDFAIMEHAPNVYTIPADIGWSDLGTWASLYEHAGKDVDGNVLAGKAPLVLEDAKNNMISIPAEYKAIIKGLDNFIVVLDNKRLLIYPKSKEQEIKKDLEKLNPK